MPCFLTQLTQTPEVVDEVQALQEAAPTFYHILTGLPVDPTEGERLFFDLPPGKGYEDKAVFGIYDEAKPHRMIGCIDLIRGYPRTEVAFLGFFMLREDCQGQGYGRKAFFELERFLHRWPEIQKLRLAVVATNAPALGFWPAMGFAATGEEKPYKQGLAESALLLFEKPLTPP